MALSLIPCFDCLAHHHVDAIFPPLFQVFLHDFHVLEQKTNIGLLLKGSPVVPDLFSASGFFSAFVWLLFENFFASGGFWMRIPQEGRESWVDHLFKRDNIIGIVHGVLISKSNYYSELTII